MGAVFAKTEEVGTQPLSRFVDKLIEESDRQEPADFKKEFDTRIHSGTIQHLKKYKQWVVTDPFNGDWDTFEALWMNVDFQILSESFKTYIKTKHGFSDAVIRNGQLFVQWKQPQTNPQKITFPSVSTSMTKCSAIDIRGDRKKIE